MCGNGQVKRGQPIPSKGLSVGAALSCCFRFDLRTYFALSIVRVRRNLSGYRSVCMCALRELKVQTKKRIIGCRCSRVVAEVIVVQSGPLLPLWLLLLKEPHTVRRRCRCAFTDEVIS